MDVEARTDEVLAVVIPALDAAIPIAGALAALGRGVPGLGLDVVVADGGSTDGTAAVARELGARVVEAARGRGTQLAAGAAATEADWLLFLHADSLPQPGWAAAVAGFVADPANRARAAYFRLAFDDDAPPARRVERLAAWRARSLGLPYGDQGLLLHRTLYAALGGFAPIPIMEDVDLVRRIGRHRIVALPATIRTSAERYRRGGWTLRPARNLLYLVLWFAGVPPRTIRGLYG